MLSVLTSRPDQKIEDALARMAQAGPPLFITGKAGTGKSTLLRRFCEESPETPVVLAPTGVAALNVQGQTLHRFFNFYVDVTPQKIREKKIRPRNAKFYKKIKTIVIDEISMVRADMLDCVDVFLRMYGPRSTLPFGGVRMVFIGDLYQLPPVVNGREREIFSTHYETPYFFSAHALNGVPLEIIELETVFRQKDENFVRLLNAIRDNTVDDNDLAHLNARVGPARDDEAMRVYLTAANKTADAINDERLAALKGKLHTVSAKVKGDFGKEYFPTTPDLAFKIGAQVMMLNNDPAGRWVNGSIGRIEKLGESENGEPSVRVRLQDDNSVVTVTAHTWEVFSFSVDEGEIVSEQAGTFAQFPFRLAWAITIHKSQGKTFDNVAIDLGSGAFAAGQMYVALSRCTSFEGISLKVPVRREDIRTDPRIAAFFTAYALERADAVMPLKQRLAAINAAIADSADLEMNYVKADGSQTRLTIHPLELKDGTYRGETYPALRATVLEDGTERIFHAGRILTLEQIAG